MTPRARFYFAFRSPFSWLAAHRLRMQTPHVSARIERIPYWEPDPVTSDALARRGIAFHYVSMSKAKHLYILQDTKRLADRLGLRMRWPVDVNPRWDVPHFAWLKARRLGFADPFYDAVVAARWQTGANICDPAVIGDLARQLGLDGEAVATAVEDAEIREEAIECLARAYEDDIFGVPYFRFGSHRFWGFDRLDTFLEVFLPRVAGQSAVPGRDQLEAIPREVQAVVGAYDTDTAGGCG